MNNKTPAHPTLVCFAVKEESEPFRKIIRHDAPVQILVTGMGKRNAVKSFLDALEQRSPGLVLSCGFAGGLDPVLSTGTVVYDADPNCGLQTVLESFGAKHVRFFCASRIAVTSLEKRNIRETTGADAVEMESEHIRALCKQRNIPSATVRVISDAADEELPLDFNALMTQDDTISYGRLSLEILRSPGKIPQLLSLQKRSAMAANNLAVVLKELLQKTE